MEKSEKRPLKCLIVDDEAMAHEVIKSHLSQIESALVVGQCFTGTAAYNFILHEEVDIVFLDINMPELTGLELLKSLIQRPKVILTTAYSSYALESYDWDVVDYLLKPIGFARFLQAFNKVNRLFSTEGNNEHCPEFIDIKFQGLPFRVNFSNLEYVEGLGNYVKLYLPEKMLLVKGKMHLWELQTLPRSIFCRVHKSFIVNLAMVSGLSNTRVILSSGKQLPLGRQYKALLQERLNDLS